MQYVYIVFCDWLLLCSIKLLKLTCVAACVSSLLLVIAVSILWRDVEALISEVIFLIKCVLKFFAAN